MFRTCATKPMCQYLRFFGFFFHVPANHPQAAICIEQLNCQNCPSPQSKLERYQRKTCREHVSIRIYGCSKVNRERHDNEAAMAADL